MTIRIFMLTCLIFPIFAHADDQYIFDQNSQQQSLESPLDKPIAINRTFININAVVTKLKSLGLTASIKTSNQSEVQNILINSNGTINDFINIAASKFNYSTTISGTNIIFSAIGPAKIKPATESSKIISTPKVALASSPLWVLSPKEKTLRNALTSWSKKAGWQLVWNVKADYPITTTWSIPGTFESAINEVLKASQSTDVPLMATMHDNNHVLEIFSTTTAR